MDFDEVLNEDYYDAFKYKPRYANESRTVEVWKNPNSSELKDILRKQEIIIARGVLLKKGDLYLASGKNIIHEDILKILSKQGLLEFNKFWHEDILHLEKYLCVTAFKNRKLIIADSYQKEPVDIIEEKYFDIYKNSLKKNNKIFKLGIK